MVQPNDRWRKLGRLGGGRGDTNEYFQKNFFIHLDVDLPPMVGREDEGLERSLVEAARRREDVGRDVDLYIFTHMRT